MFALGPFVLFLHNRLPQQQFSESQGGSEPYLHNFFKVAKNCVLLCLSNVDKKKLHGAVFLL